LGVGLRAYYGATTDRAFPEKLVDQVGVLGQDNRGTTIEGATWGELQAAIHPELAIVSDGASQFDCGQHATCWVHAEWLLERLVPGSDAEGGERDEALAEVLARYSCLKAYHGSRSLSSPGRCRSGSTNCSRAKRRSPRPTSNSGGCTSARASSCWCSSGLACLCSAIKARLR